MGKKYAPINTEEINQQQFRPALTPEARENQLISLAYDLAEKRLREGTASSQEVTHFLKMGSAREKLEQERIRSENNLAQAKIENMQSQERSEELYKDAMEAFKSYVGGTINDTNDPSGGSV